MLNQSLIHADIFFFISTIALVVISIGIIAALVYFIGILRNLRDISERFKKEGEEILSDVKKVRAVLREEGVKFKYVFDLVRNFFIRKAKKAVKIKDSIIK